MRFIRLLFVVVLATVLVAVALANREIVTLSAFPANLGAYLDGEWSIDLPLFLVIFLTFALGMLSGLLWEWLRESHIRREARLRSAEVSRLQSEVGDLRNRHAAPRDEVLGIVDTPHGPRRTAPASTPALPLQR